MLLLRKDLFDRIYLFDPVYCSGHGILLLNHGGILVTVSYDSKQKRVYWVEKSIVNKYHVLSSNFDGLDVRRHRLAARGLMSACLSCYVTNCVMLCCLSQMSHKTNLTYHNYTVCHEN